MVWLMLWCLHLNTMTRVDVDVVCFDVDWFGDDIINECIFCADCIVLNKYKLWMMFVVICGGKEYILFIFVW